MCVSFSNAMLGSEKLPTLGVYHLFLMWGLEGVRVFTKAGNNQTDFECRASTSGCGDVHWGRRDWAGMH